MKDLFIDCPTGISSDMLLAALLDLGVPKDFVESSIKSLPLVHDLQLNTEEDKSYGIRGLRVSLEGGSEPLSPRRWTEIRDFITSSKLLEPIKNNVLLVFNELAEAESSVHGCDLDEVHFHEIGSISNLIKVVGIFSAIDYLKVQKIYCMSPPAGSGTVLTSHGYLPVPVPTVLEIAKRRNIILLGGNSYPIGELTTPTGIALMSVIVDRFEQPSSFNVCSIGVGLGTKDLKRTNVLRVSQLESSDVEDPTQITNNLVRQSLICQEAWVDDSTPEDIAELIKQLRLNGAIEVISYPIQMKKGRGGVCIKALVSLEVANELRLSWLLKGTTLGLREIQLERWVLPRRKGFCSTPIGKIAVKQVRRPDGKFTFKPEHKDLIRLSNQTGMLLDDIRKEVLLSLDNFTPEENWTF